MPNAVKGIFINMGNLISVIVPIYNVEIYLKRCVDSIINQSYRNLEIILVDDGSPDNCGVMCDEYKTRDDSVKVIHKKNGGLSDARNVGLELANGDYITFVDSDDWINQKYIEKLYKLLIDYEADISVSNFIRTKKENIIISEMDGKIIEYSNIEALEQYFSKYYVQMVVSCSKLYNRKLFKDIEFPVGKVHEDEFTTHKLIYKAKKIVFTEEQLYYYWQRSDSITGLGFNVLGRFDYIEALTERSVYYKKAGINILWRNTVIIYIKQVVCVYNELVKYKCDKGLRLELKKNTKKLFADIINNKLPLRYKICYLMFVCLPEVTVIVFSAYFDNGKNLRRHLFMKLNKLQIVEKVKKIRS